MAHFCSCNLGDRYQGYSLMRAIPEVEFTCVNFADIDALPHSIEEYYGEKFLVHSPRTLLYDADLAVFLTGSFDDNSPHVALMRSVIEHKIPYIIWGGFHGVDDTFVDRMRWLKGTGCTFFGRGKDDTDLFGQITSEVGHLGGDPLLAFRPCRSAIAESSGHAAILSVYLYENNRDLLDKVLKDRRLDLIVCIDTFIDRNEEFQQYIARRGVPIVVTNSPREVQSLLGKSSLVYSSRLHGAILSLPLEVPVIILSTDGSARGKRSFKFHSVGFSGNDQLCQVVTDAEELTKLSDPSIHVKNVRGYIEATHRTFNFIRDRAVRSTSS